MNIEEVLNYNPSTSIQNDEQELSLSNSGNNKHKRLDMQSMDLTSHDLTSQDIEKLIEQTEHVNEINENTLKRLILQLERRILKNQEMRIKHADNPSKFMDSEIELFDIIKEMHMIATQPALFCTLIHLNIIPQLLGLLSHENTDIACAIVALIQELTDLDDVDEIDEVGGLMKALIDSQITVLLVNNMERLDESVKEESEGIYNSLAIIENLTDYKPELSKDVKPLIQWILKKLKSKPIFYPNKLYASEILSILLQNSEENRSIIGTLNGIDILLHVVSYYKRHDPSTADEEEFVENLFNCLCSSLFLSNRNRELFYKAEGIELMILILKEKRRKESNTDVRVCSLKLLSHCLSIAERPDDLLRVSCDKFVEILGLRVLMPIFLKPSSIIGQRRKRKQTVLDQVEEHSLSIILALLRFCRRPELKYRVLNKFREQNGVKTERLVELHLKYWERLKQFDEKVHEEQRSGNLDMRSEEEQQVMFLRRLNEGGLFTLQLIDHIILLISAPSIDEEMTKIEDVSQITIKERIIKLLNMHKTGTSQINHIEVIKSTVLEYVREKDEEDNTKDLLDLVEKF